MTRRKLGRSDLSIAPIVFGGNVFGWSADEKTSFTLLDAFVDAGFNAIDTADAYSHWVPGNKGGESETIIGRWLKARGRRDDVVIFTKVGGDMGFGQDAEGRLRAARGRGFAAPAADGLYRSLPDPFRRSRPPRRTRRCRPTQSWSRRARCGCWALPMSARTGCGSRSQRAASSAFRATRRCSRSTISMTARAIERDYEALCETGAARRHPLLRAGARLPVREIPLGAGFSKSAARGEGMAKYLNARGLRILDALDVVAGRHASTPAQIALAWLLARPSITAPIVSATNLPQLAELLKAPEIRLSSEDLAALNAASAEDTPAQST